MNTLSSPIQDVSSRPPDYEKGLAETILDVTHSHSSGVSLLTRDGKELDVCGNRFFWPAIAGMWKPHIGSGTPRDFEPDGDVLDRTALFRYIGET
jgi:hypothetical protein